MSGGIAYILKDYIHLINQEMVDLDPLNEDDFVTIKEQLNKHVSLTRSQLADEFLQNWNEYREKFIKVIPRDYKEVLRKRALQKSTTLV